MVGAVGIEPTTFAKIIARVESVYPTLAQQTRVQGGSNRSDVRRGETITSNCRRAASFRCACK
jgi:hypothetical protein